MGSFSFYTFVLGAAGDKVHPPSKRKKEKKKST